MTQAELLTNKEHILSLLPHQDRNVRRLERLAHTAALPVVTVMGKYNHGKSRLLNELLGDDRFSVADKRETKSLLRAEHEGITWIDAPGLDADVDAVDDEHAEEALWVESDIRFFVHAAKEGELDAAEIDLMKALNQDEETTKRKTLFVLTQIDQVADDETMERINTSLRGQMGERVIHPVSSVRHRKGVEQSIPVFIEKSGIPALRSELQASIAGVQAAREHEQAYYFEVLQDELQALHQQHSDKHAQLSQRADEVERNFLRDLSEALEQGTEILQDVMQEPEVDHAMDPGIEGDTFRMTAGKQERARIHIAYSQACLLVRSVLTQYDMLRYQPKGDAGMTTVMVMVMGISVKMRSHLREMFGTEASRAELRDKFKYYFDISDKRCAALAEIEEEAEKIQAVERAQATLKAWQSLS